MLHTRHVGTEKIIILATKLSGDTNIFGYFFKAGYFFLFMTV